ncbi:MAG: S-methyl-5-thioribose-1-phosphate isomerase [Planctomycetes bacterium]|nr:S-methyl-5-thioribose-1-phosphate isomerase [Planctomycetota bacterium]
MAGLPATVAWRGDAEDGVLLLLDQTLLPHAIEVLELRDRDGVVDAIARLAVRGAPFFFYGSGYHRVLPAFPASPSAERRTAAIAAAIRAEAAVLAEARPTAVNLRWALERCVTATAAEPSLAALLTEARAIHREDEASCAAIGRHGAALVPVGGTVLTHCNTGRLATAGDGTALAVLFAAWRAGTRFRVLADETRPLLQGARLTALELQAAGIPVELLCDGAAAGLIARGEVQLVITGADRIAANGDCANKVGTYGLALAAAAHEVPFYVAAPRSTFDPSLADGRAIPSEDRAATEGTELAGHRLAPAGVPARNPAFDVTPAALVRGLVTDHGLLRPPFDAAIKQMFAAGR